MFRSNTGLREKKLKQDSRVQQRSEDASNIHRELFGCTIELTASPCQRSLNNFELSTKYWSGEIRQEAPVVVGGEWGFCIVLSANTETS